MFLVPLDRSEVPTLMELVRLRFNPTIVGLYEALVIGRIQNFATFDEILRYFAKISSL
jgi:hypothetical protein